MKKLLGAVIGLCFTTVALASQISYDQIPITPQCWEEVDLTYNNYINGKKYTEQANLLRPISWIKHNHLDKVGSTVHLTKEQLEIDVDVKVIAIKPTPLSYNYNNSENIKPVITTFITHSNAVWDYTVKDRYRHKETIQAVSNHFFYSLDRHNYIPIGEFQLNMDHLLTDNNSKVQLSSKVKHNKGVEAVYNFEATGQLQLVMT